MRAVLSGGGSGGHIYPALAISRGLLQVEPEAELLYLGTNHGLERDLVPRENIPFRAIHAQGLMGRGLGGKVRGVVALVRGVHDAWRILKRFKPDVVIGTGGYASGPVGLAANLLHVPLIIQEQNAFPGLTNRNLAKRAAAVFVPFEEARQYFPPSARVIIAGNPVSVAGERLSKKDGRKRLGLKPEVRLLMATGGSQGARAINELMLDLLGDVHAASDLGMIWATGKRYYRQVKAAIQERFPDGLDESRVQVFEYFYQIQTVYQAADLFVGRAGMGTITDCEAFGVPAVLIPSPNVSEDHQTKNAQVIETRGAGMLIRETDLARDGARVLELLRDTERTGRMAENMRALFDADAVDRIVRTVVEASRASKGRL
ncbi:undecaprenyldiphospho-muramoylpentapeptide beta-N-acetylglucosaminyltransferase [Sulfobacillus sp. DSM 109850]|uniref:UDP-N-acetylglucosamine--N-acetylmuramyl-(pentapeptide) pyrophosphoryl-undecaprenol N-acetylglucosamine transferase n=2 Tax=Sulfobacillus harzensis TaxID=2729629 RepID=A0A7Y0L1K5_9FIRM|nr:undecaprenyldiphospho-muramoylpentapeptide beta-N-acetylglucosaminyltransferase [Sulfobacillus harzensis]